MPDGILDEIGNVINIKFLHDTGPVGVHGTHADIELPGYLAARLPLGNHDQYIVFPPGEQLVPAGESARVGM